MKIGLVLDEYHSEDGGAYTFQREIFETLCNLRAETKHEFVVLSNPNKQLENQAMGYGIKWVRLLNPALAERGFYFLSRYFSKLKVKTSLEKLAKQNKVTFLWFLSPRTRAVDFPFMTIVLDLQHRLQPWFPEVSANGEWKKRERHYLRLFSKARAIITGTEAGKREIQAFYGVDEKTIKLLPHPAPIKMLHASSEISSAGKKLSLIPGFVFYPAQFWVHKNHENLLKALSILRQQGKVVNAVFTGSDQGNRSQVEGLIQELDLQAQVQMLGFVSQEELIALYRNALTLVYPSYFGPENLPPLEAFALGCPVIAADVSGAREQLGDAAVLVDPRDPAAIADAISRVADDTHLRDQLIMNGKERARRWTTVDFVRGAFKILDSLEPSIQMRAS